uniref:NYN domain-containing protein n=1 Tax=Desulfatirhabdium butyrativorans TaxID=340467 RepID=A0A7C4RNG5_9BACT
MIKTSSAPGSKSDRTHPGQAEPRGFFFSSSLLRHASPTMTAVMVDAAFFLNRALRIYGHLTPEHAAKRLHGMALDHLNDSQSGQRTARLYRIFVYDAPPAAWKGHYPISKLAVDLSRSETAIWRRAFHEALRGMRKVALRLGEIPTNNIRWELRPEVLKELLNGRRNWQMLKDEDFRLNFRQKGVDMRLGIDIASIALKKQVNQIVLVSGDADFVPAAKLARREGIDFILDPMWATIRPQLFEHIDGLRSVCPKTDQRGKPPTEACPND